MYLSTAFLLLSGIAVLGEGRSELADLLGGHVAAASWHRWVGFALVGGAALLLLARPGASGRFLAESSRFDRRDLRWFAAWPGFVLRPARRRPASHRGHFDPGQRVLNLVVVLSLAVLAGTGILMAFPALVLPEAFAVSLRVHRLATWILAGAVAGHLVVATGVLRSYRGVWRAMHRDGHVPASLARALWPAWAEADEREAPRGRARSRRTRRRRTRGRPEG